MAFQQLTIGKCASLSLRDLVSLTGCRIFAVGLLRIFIDDSADQKQEKVILAGAFVGWYHQFSGLRKAWRKCLKKNGLAYFRSTECRSLQGEFSRYRDDVKYPKPKGMQAANQVRDDLDAIIHESGVMGVAACVPMQDYNAIRATEPDAAAIFPEDGYEMALQSLFQLCATEVLTVISKDLGPQRIAFICDHSTSALKIEKMFAEFRECNPDYADVLESLVHRDDKKNPELQAADLMAHLAKDRFGDWLDDPAIFTDKPELKRRLERLSVFSIAVCNKEWLLDLLKVERNKRAYLKSQGVR